MLRETRPSSAGLSRRAALGGAGAAVAVGLGHATRTAAQEGSALATHPLVGTWAVLTTGGVVPQLHGADGSVIAAFFPSYVDPALGLTFQGSGLGRWEATDERRAHFTFFQALSNADGGYVGTFQLESDLEASEDGQSWSGTNEARIITRDAANIVTSDQVVPFDPPVTAVRIGTTIESVVLPVATPMAGTPEP